MEGKRSNRRQEMKLSKIEKATERNAVVWAQACLEGSRVIDRDAQQAKVETRKRV